MVCLKIRHSGVDSTLQLSPKCGQGREVSKIPHIYIKTRGTETIASEFMVVGVSMPRNPIKIKIPHVRTPGFVQFAV